ncbi:MAG TPA: S41 family peptidase [Candidatus Paceibacterota bacterium]|nr:S41 family peptidase [Candidatus Paceibacterota bacterium]
MERTLMTRAIAFALVAAVAFGAGVLVAGPESGVASVINALPLVGSGLDATPAPAADLAPFWEEWNALAANYVITHASSSLPTAAQMIQGAMEGLAASYGDPYTVYFPPQQASDFNSDIAGNFEGVGMEIDVVAGVLTVVSPLKGTPAAAAGIKAGDQIVAIDGTSTEGMSTDEAVDLIRGPAGSTVDLSIVREGVPLDINVVRASIQVPEEDDAIIPGTQVYKIALYEFTANSADLFDRAFSRFRQSGATHLIIDLRGNPGGYLDAAVDIASHFLPKGATIVTEDYGGKKASDVDVSKGYLDFPAGDTLAVLVDGGSASASEILAGALQDSKKAEIMGEQSFGKGSVQTVIPIGEGELKVTIARWLTPAGHWIMGNGITPDIKVPAASSTPATPAQDPQLMRAVQYLTTGK